MEFEEDDKCPSPESDSLGVSNEELTRAKAASAILDEMAKEGIHLESESYENLSQGCNLLMDVKLAESLVEQFESDVIVVLQPLQGKELQVTHRVVLRPERQQSVVSKEVGMAFLQNNLRDHKTRYSTWILRTKARQSQSPSQKDKDLRE